jgi:hypothetical protein
MDSVLSSLGTLISNIKSLTLPGLVAALGFAILLWPPQPIDVVTDVILNPRYAIWPTTKSGLTALANTERRVKSDSRLKSEKDHPGLKPWENNDFGPVCWTRPGTATAPPPSTQGQPAAQQSNTSGQTARPDTSGGASDANTSQAQPETVSKEGRERVLRQPQSLPENKPVAVANQFDLERIQRQLQDCADKESALSGAEQSLIADITAEVSVLTNERDAIRDTYLGYEKSANPLRDLFLEKLRKKEDEIRDKQTEIHEEEQLQRERVRRSAELTHLASDITLRLGEPGRLRPLQKFDDFLASLGSHVVAFLSLALGWSLIFDPINRAVFGYAYETKFDDQLDYVRDDRKPIFVYPKTPTTPSKWWLLPTLLGFLGALLLVLLSDPRPAAPDLCTLSAPICSLINKPPQMLLWLVACLAATLSGLGLAVLLAGQQADKKKKQAEKKEKEERAKAAGTASTADAASQAESAQDTDKPEIRDVALRTRVALFMQKPPADAKAKRSADEKKGKEDAHLLCLDSLKEGWEKIRQPEYAIGQGLITRDEYKGIRDEYYTQSLISTGLVLPVMLLTFGFEVTPQLGLGGSKWYQLVLWVFLVLMESALIMVGADRRNKFEVELETRIAGQYLKNCEAAKKPADDSTPKPPTLIELIQAELKKAKIVEKTDFKLELGDDPAKKR